MLLQVNLVDAVARVRPAVVQIGSGREVRGTGFLVDDDARVATAWHVVDGVSPIHVGLALSEAEIMRANFNVVAAEVVAMNERDDLAILQMQLNPFRGEVTSGIVINDRELPRLIGVGVLAADRPTDGEAIAISGYPLANAVLVTTSGAVASAWAFDMDEAQVPGAHPDSRCRMCAMST